MTAQAKTPDVLTNEVGDWAWVTVTESTATEEAARQCLVAQAEDALSFDADFSVLHPERAKLLHLQADVPSAEWRLADRSIVDAVLKGEVDAFWVFDISTFIEEKPDHDWKQTLARREAARKAKAKREAVELRGPWWWRLRCRLTDLLVRASQAAEPSDRGSTSWLEDDELHIVEVRRRR